MLWVLIRTTSSNRLVEAILMSTYNIGFDGDLIERIFKLSFYDLVHILYFLLKSAYL